MVSPLTSPLLISLTSRYATAHKFRFGELMLHHKLGWQTSDQQDKAVSCEVGVLLVLASVLQAVEVGWGREVPGILRCSEGPDVSSCGHGQTPGTRASPRPLSPRQQPLLDPPARHRKVKRETPCAPRPVSVYAPPRVVELCEPDQSQSAVQGWGRQLDLPGHPEGQGAGGGSQLQRSGGLAQRCLQMQVHPAGVPGDGQRQVLASVGHPVPGLLLPTWNWG